VTNPHPAASTSTPGRASDIAGIVDRVEDARVLWNGGRREGALLCVLVAVAARARLAGHPRGVTDREAFESYLAGCFPWNLSVEYRGRLEPIEHVFYKWLRCHLVHRAVLPMDLTFSDQEGLTVRAGGAPEFRLVLSTGWFDALAECALR
jgi:hypothetical protein